MIKLSIVILSYNTKELLRDCLLSLQKVSNEYSFEIIVPDNGSTDGSSQMVKSKFPKVKLVEIGKNLGFSAGNNKARPFVHGEYVLFLNSDTVMMPKTIKETLYYMEMHPKVGAMTCRVELPNGQLDKDARRSFITPWIGLTHIFLKLDRLFPKSKTFAKYWYGYLPEDQEHEVDAIQGAFFLTRKKLLDKVGWWDEDYFLDGEDIDLSYRIHQAGYKIVYYPKVKIIHYRGATKGKHSSTKSKVSLAQKLRFRTAGVDSQKIFYKKHLWHKYPLIVNIVVVSGISVLKLTRILKTLIFG